MEMKSSKSCNGENENYNVYIFGNYSEMTQLPLWALMGELPRILVVLVLGAWFKDLLYLSLKKEESQKFLGLESLPNWIQRLL